jgi:hypothetical protein
VGNQEKIMEKINYFRKGMAFILKWEGGYVNDPDDPGKATKWGISQRAYPDLDIKNLSEEDCLRIYAKDYWDACNCDDIPFPSNVAVFDTAVNCGVDRAKKWFNEAESLEDFMNSRKQHYYNLLNQNIGYSKYIKGWLRRLADLQKFIEINSPE